jgi:NAD-dependent dihydropyrimidine dehydrogenase PreA subunit/flavodoxin
MILYFTGTGNSEYVAKRIADEIGDKAHNLFQMIKDNRHPSLHSDKPWIIISPTYAWRIPHILKNWLEKATLSGNKKIYFVMTCGGNTGNAGKYLKSLSVTKNMIYLGCYEIIMPENYIAMFSTPTKEEAIAIIENAENKISKAANFIKSEKAFPKPEITCSGKISSGIVNSLFYPVFVHAKKFYTTDNCISCGKCVSVCPLNNIHLKNGRPIWEDNCTHCMACICRCPKEAIEYGKHSKGLPRYVCPKQSF